MMISKSTFSNLKYKEGKVFLAQKFKFKIVDFLGEKLVKVLGFVKIEFLDRNLTFRIVQCEGGVN